MVPSDPDPSARGDSPLDPVTPTVVFDLDDGSAISQETIHPNELYAQPTKVAPPILKATKTGVAPKYSNAATASAEQSGDSTSSWSKYNEPFVPKEKDPFLADLEKAVASVRSIGAGIRLSMMEFKSAFEVVRTDKGVVADFFIAVLNNAFLRLIPVLIIVVLVTIVVVVRKNHHRATHTVGAVDASGISPAESESYTADAKTAFGPSSAASTGDPGAERQWSEQQGDTPPGEMPQTFKSAVSAMIAHMEINNAVSPGGPIASSAVADTLAAPPGPTSGQSSGSAVSSEKFTTGLTAEMLQPRAKTASSPPQSSVAGVGLKQPWTEDVTTASEYNKPDVFSNGDENAIMMELYKEYAADPNSNLGKEAGADLAAIYWLRASSDLRSGNKSQVLTDWKRVAVFDHADPIAQQARENIRLYKAKLIGKGAKPKRHAASTKSHLVKSHKVGKVKHLRHAGPR